jgi:Glycosyl transferases group 1
MSSLAAPNPHDGPPSHSLDFVVVGGFPLDAGTNHRSVQTVRALAAKHRVLYIYDDHQGSALRHLWAPRYPESSVWHKSRRSAFANVFRKMQGRQISERLWLAPINGYTKLLPLSYPESVRARSSARLANFIQSETSRIGMRRPILWFYWWFFPELATLPNTFAVYDNIDEHSDYQHNQRWPAVQRRAKVLECRLLQAIDLAYAQSYDLADSMRETHAATMVKTPGIDSAVVDRAIADPDRPHDLASLPHPLIGYAGNTGNRVDWHLVSGLAQLRPNWTTVFVGGECPPELVGIENIHFLPGRSYPEMLRAVREFDVGIIPWIDSPATRGAYSYKALDYLAAGRKVIATALPFSIDLANRHPQVVATVSSREEWLAAIQEGLEHAADPLTMRECAVAAHSRTTETRTAEIVADIHERW